jgi:hypothetical protein
LCGFGVFALLKFGYSLLFAIFLFVISLIIIGVAWQLKHQNIPKEIQTTASETCFVQPSNDWSKAELAIWQAANQHIDAMLQDNKDWSQLKFYGFTLVTEIAQAFNKKPFDFSVPEALTLLEEITKRYREVLKTHVPGVDYLRVTQLKWIYDFNDKYGSHATKTSQTVMNTWRVVRMINPVSAVINEVRGQIISNLFDDLSDNLQNNAKKALLQEVSAVCIDLYSGRFSIEESQITKSKTTMQDEQQHAENFEPIRIVVVGQISSGKSSLINALKQNFEAEVDTLPSTDILTCYQFLMAGKDTCHLIDLPGLDGEVKVQQQLLKEMVEADLILWVVKANQPSRALDCQLKQKLIEYYQEQSHISRKQPEIISIVNQVDRLKPSQEWTPPYDWKNPKNNKAKIIADAVAYNQQQLQSLDIYPLSISKDKINFGLIEIQEAITQKIIESKNVQRNRQRYHTENNQSTWQQGKALFKGAKIITKHTLK